MNENENGGSRWHLGKEIPLALITTIIAQTVAAIWWAAGVSRDIYYVKQDIVYLKAQFDSNVALASQVQRNNDHNAEHDRRLMDLEARVREIEKRR